MIIFFKMTTKINLSEEFGREGMEFWVPVPNTPEKFKNPALFQFTVTVHSKTIFKPEEFGNADFVF